MGKGVGLNLKSSPLFHLGEGRVFLPVKNGHLEVGLNLLHCELRLGVLELKVKAGFLRGEFVDQTS
jgi:hypothetical protein